MSEVVFEALRSRNEALEERCTLLSDEVSRLRAIIAEKQLLIDTLQPTMREERVQESHISAQQEATKPVFEELITVLEEDDDPLATLEPSLVVCLKSHQKDGVRFLVRNLLGFNKIRVPHTALSIASLGCVLADGMGLGKTTQTLAALFIYNKQCNHHVLNKSKEEMLLLSSNFKWTKVLVVAPVTVLSHWAREINRFNEWVQQFSPNTPKILHFPAPLIIDSSCTRSMRQYLISSWSKQGGILLSGFEFVSELICNPSNQDLGSYLVDRELGPDVLVVDESHRLRNDTLQANALSQIRTQRRVTFI
jgi:hypothetical protein